MKNLKRFLVLQLLILFIIPLSFAEIIINLPEKSVYNLGEKVMPDISIKEDENHNGFFSLHLICDNYNLQYYAIPLSVDAGARTQLTVPDLTLFEPMSGTCRIKSDFEIADGKLISTESSNEFLVTNKIIISMDENLQAKPGETIIISADIKKESGSLVSKGAAEISFLNVTQEADVESGRLDYKFNLGYKVDVGYVPMTVVVRDGYGNFGRKDLSLKIIAIPTRIENQIVNDVLVPGDTLKAKIVLYGHDSEIIEGVILNVRIFDPDKNLMTETEVKSLDGFGFSVYNDYAPGEYFLVSTLEDIKEQSAFTIEGVKKITMKQEDNMVYIENTGNIDYEDEVTIVLENEDEKYLINKKINLKPQETISIDLSKEVPQGTYDIILPEEVVEADSVESADEDAQELFGPINVIKDVLIEDNRDIMKKTSDGLNAISGAAITTAKIIASKPTLASIVLVVIILGIVTYYNRSFIINRVKKENPDDTDHIFEDFQFDGENENHKPRN